MEKLLPEGASYMFFKSLFLLQAGQKAVLVEKKIKIKPQ